MVYIAYNAAANDIFDYIGCIWWIQTDINILFNLNENFISYVVIGELHNVCNGKIIHLRFLIFICFCIVLFCFYFNLYCYTKSDAQPFSVAHLCSFQCCVSCFDRLCPVSCVHNVVIVHSVLPFGFLKTCIHYQQYSIDIKTEISNSVTASVM